MVLLLRKFYWFVNHFDEYADPRAEEYILLKSYYYLFGILGLYLAFVFKIGPYLMKSRNPMELKNVTLIYNAVQVILNAYALTIINLDYIFDINLLFCTNVDRSYSPYGLKMVYLHYSYVGLKFIDLIDTIIMVLRKRTKQVSFLHVYHHIGMCVGSWLSVKYMPGGHVVFVGFFNCLVHVIMYMYYFLTAWNSEYSKNVWWKKYLTQIQLLQHVVITLCFGLALFNTNCNYNKIVCQLFVTQGLVFVALFSHFYYKTYVEKKK